MHQYLFVFIFRFEESLDPLEKDINVFPTTHKLTNYFKKQNIYIHSEIKKNDLFGQYLYIEYCKDNCDSTSRIIHPKRKITIKDVKR